MYKRFFIFLLLIAFLILSGLSFLGENDDWALWYMLKKGECVTLILSYPLSCLLSYLYRIFPNMEWYSITIVFYLILISFIISFLISKIRDKRLKILSTIGSALIITHFLMSITVTSLTMLIISISLVFVFINQTIFWILLLLASLLRVDLIIGLSPLFILTYIIFFRKKSFKKYHFILAGFVLSTIFFIHYLPQSDKDYTQWLKFVKARAYFMDLHGEDTKNILSKEEKFINHTWWTQDKDILPTDKVIKAADNPSSLKIVILSYKNLSLQKLIDILIRYKMLIFLFPLSIYLILKENNKIRKILYILMLVTIFTLIIARDMERVVYPLTILWTLMIFLKFMAKNEKEKLIKISYILITLLIADSYLNRIYNYNEKEKIKSEFFSLLKKHPYNYELSLGFPNEFGILSMTMIQNHLFEEEKWPYEKIFLDGWVSRHPIFYKTHNISFENYKGKYENYYQFMIDKSTAFIGSKNIDPAKKETILKIYDKKFGKGCKHEIIKIDETKHFALTKIIKKCKTPSPKFYTLRNQF